MRKMIFSKKTNNLVNKFLRKKEGFSDRTRGISDRTRGRVLKDTFLSKFVFLGTATSFSVFASFELGKTLFQSEKGGRGREREELCGGGEEGDGGEEEWLRKLPVVVKEYEQTKNGVSLKKKQNQEEEDLFPRKRKKHSTIPNIFFHLVKQTEMFVRFVSYSVLYLTLHLLDIKPFHLSENLSRLLLNNTLSYFYKFNFYLKRSLQLLFSYSPSSNHLPFPPSPSSFPSQN